MMLQPCSLARQPAHHGSSRPLVTADDHDGRPSLACRHTAASERSRPHSSRSASDGRWTTGAMSSLIRGNHEVKPCSHFKAALLE